MTPAHRAPAARSLRAAALLAGAALACAAPASPAADNLAGFHRAVRVADGGAVQAWIARGGALDEPDRNGRTALQVAVRYGHVELVRELIAAGAALDARDSDGWTALHHAAAGNAPVAADLLLTAGAAVDPMDPYRYTPLHLAARDGHERVCDRLLDAGADATRRIDVGFTAADLASDRFPELNRGNGPHPRVRAARQPPKPCRTAERAARSGRQDRLAACRAAPDLVPVATSRAAPCVLERGVPS